MQAREIRRETLATARAVSLPKRMKRRAAFSSARRFNSYTFVCTSYVSSLVPGVPLLSALPLGRAFMIELPIAPWARETPRQLHSRRHAVVGSRPLVLEERNSPVRDANIRAASFSQRRVLVTRAPLALTFSVNVDSDPGVSRCPSNTTGISMEIRRSNR